MADLIDILIYVIPLAILFGGGIYAGIKRLITNLAKAFEDDEITKEEFLQAVADVFNIINILKGIIPKKK